MTDRTSPNPHRRASAVAITVLLAGLAASLAGNIQSIHLDSKAPGVGAYLSAVWWPMVLFGMIELAIHVPWSQNIGERILLGSSIGTIAGLAFYISYFHLAHVLSDFGYDQVSSYIGPLAVDMAMLVATAALRRIGQERRILAKLESGHSILANPASGQMANDLGHSILAKPEFGQMANPDSGHSILAKPEMAKDVQDVAKDVQDELATVDKDEDDLDKDWRGLDWDAGLKDLVPEIEPDTEDPEPEPEPEPEPKNSRLVTVPAAAAEEIRLALQRGATKAELTALDKDLAARRIAPTERTARRWRSAVRNDKARVS